MSYVSKEWVTGETITADALNHIENGIEECCGDGNRFLCTEHYNSQTGMIELDKTWQEIRDAFYSGKNCIVNREIGNEGELLGTVTGVIKSEYGTKYSIFAHSSSLNGIPDIYETSSADGYPGYED